MSALARAALVVALALAGCATPSLVPGESKEVRELPLPPYASHEECFALAEGDEVAWRFAATAPLDFDVRYRDGAALVLPIVKERVTADTDRFVARQPRRYCLSWEAKAQGTPLDYRIDLKAAGP